MKIVVIYCLKVKDFLKTIKDSRRIAKDNASFKLDALLPFTAPARSLLQAGGSSSVVLNLQSNNASLTEGATNDAQLYYAGYQTFGINNNLLVNGFMNASTFVGDGTFLNLNSNPAIVTLMNLVGALEPSQAPTQAPSKAPTNVPSRSPSASPTLAPTLPFFRAFLSSLLYPAHCFLLLLAFTICSPK